MLHSLLQLTSSEMMTIDRETLIESYAQQILDGMDMKTMECFVYDTLKDNLESYTDEELVEEVKEYNPELLES
jgi:hypothetical protein